MKKKFAILIAATVIIMCFVGCGNNANQSKTSDDSSNKTTEDKTNENGDLGEELVLYSSMTEDDLDALITCFNDEYPDINVEVVNGSAGELVNRIRGEINNPVGDLVWGGMADSDGKSNQDIFESWISKNESENSKQFRSNNGLYSMDHLSTAVFCVNKELEDQLGFEIKSYKDLLRPELKGKIVIADPIISPSAWNNLCNIMSVYGNDSDESWSYIEKLIPNLVISGSPSVCFKSVDQGEYVVGLTYEDGAVKLLQEGTDKIRLQYPEEGTSATVFGTALIKGAPHEAAAKAMIDFICSAEGQTKMADYMQGTLRFTNSNYKIPENAWLAPSDEIKWVDRDVKYLTDNKSSILAHWEDLMYKFGK